VLERHIGIRPELLAKRLSLHDLPSILDQYLQNLKWFFFQLDPHAMFANLAGLERNFERAETRYRGQALFMIHRLHRRFSLASTQVARRPFLIAWFSLIP